jgi:hypothetical protein
MIDVAGSLAIGGSFLVICYFVGKSTAVVTREFSLRPRQLLAGSDFASEPCPPEAVSRIFSGQDWEFVSATQSHALKRYFRWERKSVALLWVQEASVGMREIIRDHTALARRSENLEFTAELEIFFRYAQLRAICGILFALILLGGPQWVGGLALHANGLMLRFGRAQEALRAATGAQAPRRSLGPV